MQHYYQSNDLEIGIDEAGRGCLFGPVCVAGVILDREWCAHNCVTDHVICDRKCVARECDIWSCVRETPSDDGAPRVFMFCTSISFRERAFTILRRDSSSDCHSVCKPSHFRLIRSYRDPCRGDSNTPVEARV